jgi:Zn ribbon nucleic-acid-binding protein
MTEWFAVTIDRTGLYTSVHDEGLMLLGVQTPDWIKVPEQVPEHGGRRLRVIGSHIDICPQCRQQRVLHLNLDAGFGVAECAAACGFVFYRRRT